jgi:multicomponent Na+:H+ antiporter subunit E
LNWEVDADAQVAKLRSIIYALFLGALWLLWSGIYKPMIMGFGASSIGLVLLITHRMNNVDGDRVPVELNPIKFLGYFFWLLAEIAKSNIAVTKTILSPSMLIRQNLFTVPYTQRTDLGQVIFANSITLTPGTVSVETETGHFLVHAVSYTENDMDALADMDARVSATELAEPS